MLQSRIFNVANMSFQAIGENKILTKISEFTVRGVPTLLFCLFLNKNVCCGYLSQCDASTEHHKTLCLHGNGAMLLYFHGNTYF